MAKQVTDEAKFTGIKLPTAVKPIHYDLWLKPNFTDFTFAGKVKIDYESTGSEIPKNIVLHVREVKINNGSLGNNPLTTVTYSPGSETATLEFQDGISPQGTISLDFSGILNDQMKGFYKTTFKLDDSEVHAATTQFEATDARRCFPCWDEPAVKASFSVTLVIEKYMTVNGKQYERLALSNMPESSRTGPDTEVEVKFEKSPIMSTYLLAFIVGPFEMIESSDSRRPIRVYTTPGKKELGQFALEVATKSLPYYEDYFGIPYPLPKMDLIAIPDFTSGAMENWGLVTYRETCLLFDPKNTATDRKQYIAIVVAHELAHQWFGNLVTMEWWTHLWLNEGFASFMEYLCVDHIFPEYDVWSQFVDDAHGRALQSDSLHNSHPIEVPVQHPSEIDEIFDAISYSKGATVIRMLYNYIGDDNFRKGMKDYLTRFAYKNAQTEDLWDCLEAASNKPVRKIMSGWTAQKGYPWLHIECSKDGDDVKLRIRQEKFSADGTLPKEDAEALWMIPLSASVGGEIQDLGLLEGRTNEIVVKNVGDKPLKLNPGTIGLYRSAYPIEMTTKLFSAITDKTLSPMDRLGLQNDYYALCLAGKVSSVELLKLLSAFEDETDFTVWSSIDSCMGRLNTILSYSDFGDKYKAYGRKLYSKIYKKLGWTVQAGEKHTDAMTRALVLRRLVSFKDESVINEALSLYKTQLEGGAAIQADLRSAVYRAVSTCGDDALFDSLFAIYRASDMHEEKNRALQALSFTSNIERLKKVTEFASSSEVRSQDIVYFIMPLAASNPDAAWKYLQDNKDTLRQKYGTSHIMTSVVKASTENFASEEKAVEVTKFFEANKFPGTERSVKQSVENVRLNAGWLKKNGEVLKEFLASY